MTLQRVQAKSNVKLIKKADAPAQDTVLHSNAYQLEDEYTAYYIEAGGTENSASIIMPPYNLRLLGKIAMENNAMGPCLGAMETNIGGTGYVVEHKSGNSKDTKDADVEQITEFLDEPWPGVSWTDFRKQQVRDEETVGNRYIEVIRNVKGEITFLRRIDPTMMRLVKLDAAVVVKKKIARGGKDVEALVAVRERRFCQLINAKMVYFKEYGSTRDLDRETGGWAKVGQRLPANKRATEVIHGKCLEDLTTPYGVPRWITQAPSVIGSRKAEVFNLEFFNSGGIPPIMAFLMGGALDPTTRTRIEQILSGKASNKHRGALVEVAPASGDIDKAGNVNVKIERFGSERQQDSMFGHYDDRCEEHVRCSFRLPPLFVGRIDNMSFATAYASYVVAEAQVFAPERTKFDDQFNITIMKELNPDYRLRGLPLSVKDIDNQLRALEIAGENISGQDLIAALNEVTGMSLKYTKPKPQPMAPVVPVTGGPGMDPETGEGEGAPPAQPAQASGTSDGGKDSNKTGETRKKTTASPVSASAADEKKGNAKKDK